VTGREAHSSQTHLGVSANMAAIQLMASLSALAERLEREADPASPFTPKWPTLTVGLINGGTALNILARECVFVFDLRTPHGVDPDAILAGFFEEARALDAQMKARFDARAPRPSRWSRAELRRSSPGAWPATTAPPAPCPTPPRPASFSRPAIPWSSAVLAPSTRPTSRTNMSRSRRCSGARPSWCGWWRRCQREIDGVRAEHWRGLGQIV
jgi:hypothetical protein